MKQEQKSQFEMDFSALRFYQRMELKGREVIPDWFEPKAPFFIRHLLWRRKQNMNSIVLIVGGVRTGKSYMGLKICESYCSAIKKPFDVLKQCSFDILPFLEWSQIETDNIFMLDEVGVNLNPSEWWTIQSKIFRNFTQAQGFRRNVMILVLPSVAFLLKSIRFMCNYIIETRSQGKGMIKKLIMNHSLGKGYIMNVGSINFSLPTKRTIDFYEQMKKEWNDIHLAEDIRELKRFEEKKLLNQEPLAPIEPILTIERIDRVLSPYVEPVLRVERPNQSLR